MATEISGIKWFSRKLKNLKKNEGLPVSQRRANAERECPRLLAEHPKGRPWKISGYKWKNPERDDPKRRHKLTVLIIERRPGPPTDPPIPAKTSPPPSM